MADPGGASVTCDGSMVCLADDHLSNCRSRKSWADLDADEGGESRG